MSHQDYRRGTRHPLRPMSHFGMLPRMSRARRQTISRRVVSPPAASPIVLTVGRRIDLAAWRADVTRQQIADACGVSKQTVSRWLLDQTVPRLSDLRTIAALTDVPVEWLSAGTGVEVRCSCSTASDLLTVLNDVA